MSIYEVFTNSVVFYLNNANNRLQVKALIVQHTWLIFQQQFPKARIGKNIAEGIFLCYHT